MNDRKIEICVSTESYSCKDCISFKNVSYTHKYLTVNEFVGFLRQGYCFCNRFRCDGIVRQKDKRDSNFVSSQLLFVDVDDSALPMESFIERLAIKPTVAYTTQNDYTEKSKWMYRFRLCYALDKPICDIEMFHAMYDFVSDSICRCVGFSLKDNCGRKVSQQFCGNASERCRVIVNDDRFYSLDSFSISEQYIYNKKEKEHYYSGMEKFERPNIDIKITDKEFIEDLDRYDPLFIIEKYRDRYDYFDRTELHYEDGYALIPEDYKEIYRSWYIDYYEKRNGEIGKRGVMKVHKDGNNRRRKLYITAMVMKAIRPYITFEHLLYNLIYERQFYFDNSDSEITMDVLKRIASYVITADESKLNVKKTKKKFVVDRQYCIDNGISPNQMKNKVRKKLNDERIGEVYDCSLSVKENLKIMKDMGMKVAKSKLYQFCRDNDINTKGER